MSEPIRVLHVVGRLDIGGAESRIMDLYRQIDREKIQFDFAVHTRDICDYEEEAESLGGRLYRFPRFTGPNLREYRKAWRDFFASHREFSAVHGHMTSTASLYLPIAKRAGVPLTIAHARSAGVPSGLRGLATRLLRFPLRHCCDLRFACSRLAARAVFGKKLARAGKVTIIPNAIRVDRFRYDEAKREETRRALGLDGAFVLGHVGRLEPVKNHRYLFAVLQAVLVKRPEARLLLVGKGSLESELREDAARLGLSERILFAGAHGNVQDYYQAMDFFLLPSFYEGLPGSAVEAQACGLRCLISDTVTREAGITVLAQFASVNLPPVEWADRILGRAEYERCDMTGAIRAAGFDAADQARRLEEIYLRAGAGTESGEKICAGLRDS